MKYYFLISGFIFFTAWVKPCQGQLYLDTLDLPAIGDVQTTTIVDSIEAVNLSPGSAGENITWDFSTLTFCCVDNMNLRWVSPQYNTHADVFPEADIALKTHCYFSHNWQTHIVTEICDNRDYYIKDATGLKYYGSDYPYPNIVSGYRNVFPLLTYGQTIFNNSRIIIQKSTDSLLVTNIKDTITADGWGTIITPLNTYDAIRIYTKETVWDSLYINGIGSQIDFMPDNYYYKWYTYGFGFPILQISKGILENRPDYQIVRVAVSKGYEEAIPNLVDDSEISYAFPNPSVNEVKILLIRNSKKTSSTLYLYSLQGKVVFKKKYRSTEELIISKNDVGEGLFFYKVIFDDGNITKGKFVMN